MDNYTTKVRSWGLEEVPEVVLKGSSFFCLFFFFFFWGGGGGGRGGCVFHGDFTRALKGPRGPGN